MQQLNKDYVLVKIKYLGKINKIISKLKDQKIDFKNDSRTVATKYNLMSQLVFKFPLKQNIMNRIIMFLAIIFQHID